MSAARDETMPGGTTGGTPGILLCSSWNLI